MSATSRGGHIVQAYTGAIMPANSLDAELFQDIHRLLDRGGDRDRNFLCEGIVRDEEGFSPIRRERYRRNFLGLRRVGYAREGALVLRGGTDCHHLSQRSQHAVLSSVQRDAPGRIQEQKLLPQVRS